MTEESTKSPTALDPLTDSPINGSDPPPNVPKDFSPEDRDLAWRWFELHVTHRTNVVNFFLLATGAFAVGYAELLTAGDASAAAAVAIVAGFTSLCFVGLDLVTIRKIKQAKGVLLEAHPNLLPLFEDRPSLLGDRVLTRLFELAVFSASLLGTGHALSWW